MRLVSFDAEFNNTKERKLNLVCISLRYGEEVEEYWLHKDKTSQESAKKRMIELNKEGYIFLSYAATAEARVLLALGLDPLKFKFLDIYLEYRCILNHNHKMMYGQQYKNGKVVFTKPPKPKWERTEEDEDDTENSKPEYGLSAACFKLLKKKIDTKFKEAMRNLIISDPDEFEPDQKEEIMRYCSEDTEFLKPMFYAIVDEYRRLLGRAYNWDILFKEMLLRSEFACRTAVMEEHGYPIDVKKTKNFSSQVPNILLSCQREIKNLFPHNPPFYKLKKAEGTYTMHQKAIKDEIRVWLKSHPRSRWMLTDGGKSGKKDLSLSLKAFQRHFNYTHNYPKDNYFAQIVRFLKLKQNLNGFMPGGKTNFWDYVGSDGFVRPYMGIYTAQSSRSQPKASGFIPLKSAWMRCMISPPPGYAMASIDYKSQEFLIAALLSGDKQMLQDYLTGDVYLAFGKSSGYIPKDGTKAEYKKERDDCKPIILGIQFDMSKFGLSKDLTEKWGRKVSVEEAEKWIGRHKAAYRTLWAWKGKIQRHYKAKGHIKLADGWYMWKDNNNFRSVGNVPVQGMGACIMRKAVALAQDAGLKVTYSLHDAIYIMDKTEYIADKLKVLARCMDEAFRFYFPEHQKVIASVGLEADIWSNDFPDKIAEKEIAYHDYFGKELTMEVKRQKEYIDPRGLEEYEQFKQYLEDPSSLDYGQMEF